MADTFLKLIKLTSLFPRPFISEVVFGLPLNLPPLPLFIRFLFANSHPIHVQGYFILFCLLWASRRSFSIQIIFSDVFH